jgi:hypothetical protein
VGSWVYDSSFPTLKWFDFLRMTDVWRRSRPSQVYVHFCHLILSQNIFPFKFQKKIRVLFYSTLALYLINTRETIFKELSYEELHINANQVWPM